VADSVVAMVKKRYNIYMHEKILTVFRGDPSSVYNIIDNREI